MNMENLIEMKPKGLFRGHPKLSKKSKNTLIRLKDTSSDIIGHLKSQQKVIFFQSSLHEHGNYN